MRTKLADTARITALSGLLLLSLLLTGARADVARTGLSNPERLGSVTVRYLGIAIYDAELFTSGGTDFRWQAPMALRLTYRRGFSADQLTDATMTEITRMNGESASDAKLRADLATCYRDVKKGDEITATSQGSNAVSLWLNNRKVCTLNSAGIQKRFFGIWLAPESRMARLSPQLKGK
ncbi:chalcone isomerase family protein [uncultured Shimia sp.]|uniref:chalcone isomerase family protein n=1 Tax=uncultured Shimia sp. TaxID=573152 RepID=UPI0026320527|nr:chalcone isomerase family protein [uncultured Shimia sp.]